MRSLAKEGWEPDVVVSHSGWGCGLHSSLVWPNAKRCLCRMVACGPVALYTFDKTNRWWTGPGDGHGLRAKHALALEL